MLQKITLVSLLLQCKAILAVSDSSPSEQVKILHTDVAVIGGGASGTYGAVRLREDFNLSVVVIEPRDHLGGHTSTYIEPITNTPIDYGVQSYIVTKAAVDFFARFNISTPPFSAKRLTPLNVDVESGAELRNYVSPSNNATTEALRKWLTIIEKYESWIEPGYWDFPAPQDIPAELLLPIEEFVEQNGLEAALPRIITISGIGYGGIRNLLTFNLMQSFGPSLTRQFLAGELLRPVGSNSVLYQRALALLGSDVLLSSSVQSVERTKFGAVLSVKQGSQEYQIKAKRILFTAGPSLANLAPFALDEKEKSVFDEWAISGEWIGIASIPCLPENTSISFLPNSIEPSDQLALRDYPYQLRLDSTGPNGLGLFRVILGANTTVTADEVKKLTEENVARLQSAGTVNGTCKVDFKAESDHTRPLWIGISKDEMEDGFVQALYALQGYRSMWYSGASFAAPYSSTVWSYTDTVLPKLVADLKDIAEN
ncbi:FAD/NAD(P)-binding domain-containing protein [Phaeosphaeriaceae sp. SRC1lsM3a]|nr:FAD/NAD(P)-binding domain-containing protein [Stagonospora sp. SRC1lsM3a]